MEIREPRPEEYEALGRITVEAYLALDTSDDPDTEDHLSDDYTTTLADVADRATKAVVLAAFDPGPVGCVTYVPGLGEYAEFKDPDAAGIRMLAVAPEAQGRGIGRALTLACLDRARADHFPLVVLHSMAPMVAARHLYEGLGFERVPERDWSPVPGTRLLGYELRLQDH
jgi:ribosomal protein S18 acetylase RimI-like enzyme